MANQAITDTGSNDIILTGENLTSLKMLHDINNVHSVVTVGFQSNQPVGNLSKRHIILSSDPAGGTDTADTWSVMSYRDMAMAGSSGREYSCLLYPRAALQPINGSPDTVNKLLSMVKNPSMKFPIGGNGPWSSLPYAQGVSGTITPLAQEPKHVGWGSPITVVQNWGLAYALMQTRLQYYRSLQGLKQADLNTAMADAPIFYINGDTLLSSSVGMLLRQSLVKVGLASKTSSAFFPNMLDAQRVWQKALLGYILTGVEKPRTFQMMNSSMWNRVFEFKTSKAQQFLGGFDLDEIMMLNDKDTDFQLPDGPTKGYLLYRAFFDMKKAPNPWTLTFGSLG